MPRESDSHAFLNDAFISYSQRDREFAIKLEKVLGNYKPPKVLNLSRRNLIIFLGEEDLQVFVQRVKISSPANNKAGARGCGGGKEKKDS